MHSYEILNDPQSRAAYDARGLDGINGQGGPQGMDPSDIFAQFFTSGMFFDPAGPGRRGKKSSEVVTHPVTLEDVYNGKSVKMHLEKDAVCGQCNG
jgi:DnaJ family protein A protein 2